MRNKSLEYESKDKQYKEYSTDIANQTVLRLIKCRENKGIDRKKLESLCEELLFPTAYHSMVNFEQLIIDGKGKRQNIKGMRLATFYELCEYYNVSADYLLGFKESRHRETSADYVRSEWGFDDDMLQRFKIMKYHTDLALGNKKISEMEFISFLITNFLAKFENLIRGYFLAIDELERFNDTKVDKDTNLFKDLKTLTAIEENNLQVEYENIAYNLEQTRFELIKAMDVFLQQLKSKLE